MSRNVSQVLETKSKSLHDKLNSNNDLANFVMALLSKLIIMANQLGRPIEGIELSTPAFSGGCVRSNITFHPISVNAHGLWHGAHDILRYALGKGYHMGRALEKNPKMADFFTQMLTILEEYGRTKGIPFDELKLEKSFITPANLLVVVVAKKIVGRWD